MRLYRILFAFSLVFALTISTSLLAVHAESTISVKLKNYLGNRMEVDFSTTGNYKLLNSNIRYGGDNRFDVANNIALKNWKTSNIIVIVNNVAFADALAASPFAYMKDAPILLTKPDILTSETLETINILNPTNIFIIGGTTSVSPAVESTLRNVADVTRISGKNRFEVAKNIATYLAPQNQAILTNGRVFSDALSIAPYAARNSIPILLTEPTKLPSSTIDALTVKNQVTIIGGENSVSKGIESEIGSKLEKRIGGEDRYAVSANIINEYNLSATEVFLSNGEKFTDALTGSVLAAKQNQPLLLTKPYTLPDPINNIINSEGTTSFTILGGSASITTSLENFLPNELYLSAGKDYMAKLQNGKLTIYDANQKIKEFDSNEFTITPTSYSSANKVTIYGNYNKNYLGKMKFTIENNSIVRPINIDIPFEDYLKGVVPREMPASWNLEALKAQAVTARTYSSSKIGEVVDDTQSFQVYGGYDWSTNSTSAVQQTIGEIIRYNGVSIGGNAFFSSSNGGYTESSANVWSKIPYPYLLAQKDGYDTKYNWTYTLKKTQINTGSLDLTKPDNWWTKGEVESSKLYTIKNYIRDSYHPGSEIKIAKINNFVSNSKSSSTRTIDATLSVEYFVKDKSSGYIMYNGRIKSFVKNIKLPMDTWRSMFGTSNVKSTLIKNIVYNSITDNLEILGSGYGHGLGLSQYGANYRAAAGWSYKQIIQAYFPNTVVSK